MRYQMQQKLFSWADQFVIRDEVGSEVAVVDGKAFSWSNQLSFRGRGGVEIATVSKQWFAMSDSYGGRDALFSAASR